MSQTTTQLPGHELRSQINELAACIRQMKKNHTTRSAPGRNRLLKERRNKLIDQWQQTPDAAEYAKTH